MTKSTFETLFEKMKAHEGHSPNDPAIICINEKRGYVSGNVVVVSRRAAELITHWRGMISSPDELRLIAQYIQSQGIT